MRVGSTYWGPPSCERLLYSCIGVVNLTFSKEETEDSEHIQKIQGAEFMILHISGETISLYSCSSQHLSAVISNKRQ
jgi:hypothetical protein